VLVVDDSGPNRKICAKLMSTHKHEVYEAQDGKHCLEVFDQHVREGRRPFDLVLMDDNMPRMTGTQATAELRDRNFPGLIFGVTGDLHKESVDRFIGNGANQVLSKPLSIDVLRNNINLILS
ncbi:response regulator, partial [archaeon]